MQIYIKRKNGQKIKLTVDQSDTIKTVKSKVNQKRQIPPDCQNLTFNGKTLQDNCKLSDYNIKQQSTIQLTMRVHHDFKFEFGDLSSKNKCKQQFYLQAPTYQLIEQGLNFLTQCLSQQCQTKGQLIVVPKGFNTFNIPKEMGRCKCPACGRTAKKSNNIAYYKAKIKVQGQYHGSNQQVSWQQIADNQNQYTTFISEGNNLTDWVYLQITATPLQ